MTEVATKNLCVTNVTFCNNSASATAEEKIWTSDVIQRVVSIVVIMVLTFIGNTAIITALSCSKYRKRNNRVNIFIINLAFGDLTVCFVTMTTEILFVAFGEWVLGNIGCKLLTYIQVVTLSSTTFILIGMGFDRYMAICRPLRFNASASRARKMIIVSWLLSFVVSVPQLLIFVQTVDGYHADNRVKYGCHSRGYTAQWQRKLYVTFMSFYILIFPSILLSFCYVNVARVVWNQGKGDPNHLKSGNTLRRFIVNKGIVSLAKIKTVKMTFCIILTFIACWTPYFVTTMCVIYSNGKMKIPGPVMAFAETIALLQSAVNPIVYGIFNIRIFSGLVDIFCPQRQSPKLQNTCVRFHNANDVYCLSAFDRQHIHPGNNNIKHLRNHDKLSSSGTSSDEGSMDRPQSSTSKSHGGGCIIAESNMNGFKLRVRFMTKDHVIVQDRYGRCVYHSVKNGKTCNKRHECTV